MHGLSLAPTVAIKYRSVISSGEKCIVRDSIFLPTSHSAHGSRSPSSLRYGWSFSGIWVVSQSQMQHIDDFCHQEKRDTGSDREIDTSFGSSPNAESESSAAAALSESGEIERGDRMSCDLDSRPNVNRLVVAQPFTNVQRACMLEST